MSKRVAIDEALEEAWQDEQDKAAEFDADLMNEIDSLWRRLDYMLDKIDMVPPSRRSDLGWLQRNIRFLDNGDDGRSVLMTIEDMRRLEVVGTGAVPREVSW